MRLKRSSFLLILIILMNFSLLLSQAWMAPESAVYDPNSDSYLVSNVFWGDILSIPRTNPTNLGFFSQTANSGMIGARGLTIAGNTLWAASTVNDDPAFTQALVGYDLNTGNVTNIIPIAGGAFINDVTPGPDDIIYLSDNSNIYEVITSTGTFNILLTSAFAFNGLLYEPATNRLLYTDDSNANFSQISAMDMNTHVTSVLFVLPAGAQFLDGLTKDHLGNYYVSEWNWPYEIYRYNPNTQAIVVAATGYNGNNFTGAADIFYHDMSGIGKQNQTMDSDGALIVPNMSGGPNTFGYVDIIPFSLLDTDRDENSSFPSEFLLHQNFPNPFNPKTSINYEVTNETLIAITIYDLLGAEIVQLVNQIEKPGLKTIEWDGKDSKGNQVNGGVYIYKLTTGNYSETKKMVFLK